MLKAKACENVPSSLELLLYVLYQQFFFVCRAPNSPPSTSKFSADLVAHSVCYPKRSGISLGCVLIGGTQASGIPQIMEIGCFNPFQVP